MAIQITHAKVNQIEDWTQAKLNEYINAGLYPQGTTIADITQPSDWNDDHSSTDLDNLEKSVRGVATIDMGSTNYTLTQAEAYNSVLLIENGGGGSKTLTIPSYSTNPANYSVSVLSGGPIKIVAADDLTIIARAYEKAHLGYAYGAGILQLDSYLTVVQSASTVTTAGNSNEQIIRSNAMPISCLSDGGMIEVSFNGKKSGILGTETLRIRFGANGTTADTQIWSNTGVTGATDNCATIVRIFRASGTTVRLQTITSALSPFAGSAVDFADISVSNIDSQSMYISLTGQHNDGTETFSNYTYLVRVFNP